MNPLSGFVLWFLGIAGKEAQEAYARKKKREAAEKAAKKARAVQAKAQKEAAEEAEKAALEKARVEALIAEADRQVKLANNALELVKMRAELDENPYGEEPEKADD